MWYILVSILFIRSKQNNVSMTACSRTNARQRRACSALWTSGAGIRGGLLGDHASGHPSNKDQRKCARARQSFIRLINCRELLASTIRMNLQPISSNILN